MLFLASLVANWTIGGVYTQPNWEFMPEMVHSVPYDTYSPNPNFADGLTLRQPVAKTIARGQLPLHYGPTEKEALRAGKELYNPYHFLAHRGQFGGLFASSHLGAVAALPLVSPVSTQPLASALTTKYDKRGEFVYANYCLVCHGATGKGDGPVTVRGVPPPPPLYAEKAVKMKDGQMFHVLTYGQGNMASYASQLSREDRWLAIVHVRSLQQKAAAKKEGRQ